VSTRTAQYLSYDKYMNIQCMGMMTCKIWRYPPG